jgi:hypothetical protein
MWISQEMKWQVSYMLLWRLESRIGRWYKTNLCIYWQSKVDKVYRSKITLHTL